MTAEKQTRNSVFKSTNKTLYKHLSLFRRWIRRYTTWRRTWHYCTTTLWFKMTKKLPKTRGGNQFSNFFFTSLRMIFHVENVLSTHTEVSKWRPFRKIVVFWKLQRKISVFERNHSWFFFNEQVWAIQYSWNLNVYVWILKCEHIDRGQFSEFIVLCPKLPKNNKNIHFWVKNSKFCPN